MHAVASLLACHDCDLLQRVPTLAADASAVCPRCGAIVRRGPASDAPRQLAVLLTCATLFLLANLFPITTLEAHGLRVSCTLLEATHILWTSHIEAIAVLVFVTAIALPGIEIALLLLVKLRKTPRRWMLHALSVIRPWGMIDVFVLGLLVSTRKLADMASLVPDVAFWSFCALMVLMAVARSDFQIHRSWARVPLHRD